jgi:hypothetical protein
MNSYLLTPQAEDDLFAMWSYIAQDSVEAADRGGSADLCGVWVSVFSSTNWASPPRPDTSARAFLDGATFPKLCHRVRSGFSPASNIRILHAALDIPRQLEE